MQRKNTIDMDDTPENRSLLSRRRFLSLAGSSMLTFGLAAPFFCRAVPQGMLKS